MLKVFLRLWNILIGKSNEAIDQLEEKSIIAKENLKIMNEQFEKMKLAIANFEGKLLISESLLSKAQQEASAMNNKIDLETEKYSKMVEGDEKVKLKTIIEAYIKKHSELEKDVKSLETTYLAQKAQLDKNKEELASLNKEIENAKFATSQIEINDSINKAKGTLGSKDGFSQANQKINALKAEVEQQSLSSKAYDNLGKTKEDILIEEHEREASNINISDEFSKRLSKFQ